MDLRLQRSFKSAGHFIPPQMRGKSLGRGALPQRVQHLWRDDAYILIAAGDCMSPVIHDGDHIVFSPSEPLRSDVIAAFYNREGSGIQLGCILNLSDEQMVRAALAGRLRGNVMPAIRVAQFNPGRAGHVPANKFSAIHAMVCVFRDSEARMSAPRNRRSRSLGGVSI